jgi:hypothetical protein
MNGPSLSMATTRFATAIPHFPFHIASLEQGHLMRAVVGCSISLAMALSACSSSSISKPPVPRAIVAPSFLPPDVGSGIGSQFGNYAGQLGGDTQGPAGQHCLIFNWDRPLNKDFAIRYSSLSCDQENHEWKTTTTYTRTVIPMSQSNLERAEVQPSQPNPN